MTQQRQSDYFETHNCIWCGKQYRASDSTVKNNENHVMYCSSECEEDSTASLTSDSQSIDFVDITATATRNIDTFSKLHSININGINIKSPAKPGGHEDIHE
jgi:transcription elongation factor Elf1